MLYCVISFNFVLFHLDYFISIYFVSIYSISIYFILFHYFILKVFLYLSWIFRVHIRVMSVSDFDNESGNCSLIVLFLLQ